MWINIETVREYNCNDCGEFTEHELYNRDSNKEVWECVECSCKDNEVER